MIFLRYLPEQESRDVWPLVERKPLAAAGFVRRRLGDERFAAELVRAAACDEVGDTLERFGARDLVSGSEVVDFLLDLRLTVVNSSDRALAQLLEEERQPTA